MFGKSPQVSCTSHDSGSTRTWHFKVLHHGEYFEYNFHYTTRLTLGWSSKCVQAAVFELDHEAITEEFMTRSGIKSDKVREAMLKQVSKSIPRHIEVG